MMETTIVDAPSSPTRQHKYSKVLNFSFKHTIATITSGFGNNYKSAMMDEVDIVTVFLLTNDDVKFDTKLYPKDII